MKIRYDFVTNSSSTSYIIAFKNPFEDEIKNLTDPIIISYINFFNNFESKCLNSEQLFSFLKEKCYSFDDIFYDFESLEDLMENGSKYAIQEYKKYNKLLLDEYIICKESIDRGYGAFFNDVLEFGEKFGLIKVISIEND